MSVPIYRIRLGGMILAVVSMAAILGHQMLSGQSWLSSIYWYVITVSSVGYTESSDLPAELQLFTIAVILIGMSAAAYTLGGLLQLMTEGEIKRALGLRRMTKEIKHLDGHVVICGYGRVGSLIAKDLSYHKLPMLVIDSNAEQTNEAQLAGYLSIVGNATEETVLLEAGIEKAKALVSALSDDADNVFLTLTARNLNSKLNIIARGEHPSSEKKLRQAGAEHVVLPAVIGARRISSLLLRPHTADLFDRISNREVLEIDAQEIPIPEGNSLVGVTVRDAEAHRRHRMLVVAIRRTDGEMVFNPDADQVFQAGDLLIAMGRQDGIEEFRKRFAL